MNVSQKLDRFLITNKNVGQKLFCYLLGLQIKLFLRNIFIKLALILNSQIQNLFKISFKVFEIILEQNLN